MNNLKNETSEMMEKGVDEIKKSGGDWLDYIQKHPLQTMFFGLVAFFAAKGIAK
ncbi:hypothetical protein ACFORL_05290 [Legionella dresdenensis]|uniref:Uncharacterized protein n=1 Tax=Legionella dresdenensis TaxID=450200 RepID=A0ABV8CEF6_9GAMM